MLEVTSNSFRSVSIFIAAILSAAIISMYLAILLANTYIAHELLVAIASFLLMASVLTTLYLRKKLSYIENKSTEAKNLLSLQIQHLEILKSQAEERGNLKSQFLANMSHELRTPMHSILSFSKISLKKIGIVDNLQLIKYIETIHTSGSRLLNIINHILDISKLESGVTTFEFKKTNIEKLVSEIMALSQSYFLDKNINFEFESDIDSAEIEIDETRIAQVIQNLIGNAIKFAPDNGDIDVYLRYNSLNKKPAITFQVDDDGIGIPEDELEAVFDKFIQSSKTANGAGGTGLGLCISKELIEAHSGKIYARNNAKGGASFYFTIPVKQTEQTLELTTKA